MSTLSAQRLDRIGAALYGPRWQSALADELGVWDRTVRRWASGETPLPDHIPQVLNQLIAERIALLKSLKS